MKHKLIREKRDFSLIMIYKLDSNSFNYIYYYFLYLNYYFFNHLITLFNKLIALYI